jgi:hypothetical protein
MGGGGGIGLGFFFFFFVFLIGGTGIKVSSIVVSVCREVVFILGDERREGEKIGRL